ncbi:hypothetical protein A2Z53_00055 [Candidatus Giovannonibacteria bacterium RIFCSPHIGHO2_02_42_15]|uniref:Uncharacterized protein n=2 Tax=Candidatus Giovannoniibacteriota TaxID=1752738 RepID=A0A1F5VKZ4_9BACT|nr:MAG: hypothetical protein UV11_C0012G0002 [Candidatus Giovannonibacteria bacterium GW2011_GWF2_42_19]OGF64030.1 MAG: hypothetical protein A2Z53_00055 [Candidatus Giovannonibacteria bacterium RIFCSPHIGHO2_02_42_15]
MKKYTTDWKGIIIVFGVGIIGLIFSLYLGVQEGTFAKKAFVGSIAIVTVPVLFAVILMTVYSYASISGTTLTFVWLLFSRRTININSITDINDQPTFKAARNQFRSLYIFYKDETGEIKWIELRITIFPEKTLGKLIKDLKAINPRIELNKYAEKLMQSAQ